MAILASENQLPAAEWLVATNGTERGGGTASSPWDIASALAGRQKVTPGDTVWLRGGTYKYPGTVGSAGFVVKLAGSELAPIVVRARPGERVTLDGSLTVQEPATHLWIWGLEILVSEPRPPQPVPPDPSYRNVNRPWGGLNIHSGSHCKFINLVIHDNCQGISWWVGSHDSEVSGCLIYDNGWAGTDRGHGHAIYTQNNDGVKRITDCIMTGGYGYTMHAYGSSRAYVNGYLAEGNICYDAGTFLIGGGRPSHRIRVLTNFLYGLNLQLGYNAPTNFDCEVLGNTIVNGGLIINRFGQVIQRGHRLLGKSAPRPSVPEIILRPNKYDPLRARLAITTGTGKQGSPRICPGF